MITALLTLIANLLSALLVFELPAMPDEVDSLGQQIIGYMGTGVQVLRAFIGDTAMGVIATLLGLVLAMNAAYLVYSIVFWVLRKVPVLNIKE